MHLVFVFGTLKEGFPNSAVNTGVRIAGNFVTEDRYPFHLVGERHSPWMINSPGQGLRVEGQLFEVTDAGLERMDALERVGKPDGYERVRVRVQEAQAPSADAVEAFVYLKNPDLLRAEEVRAGPLGIYTEDHAALYRRRDSVPSPEDVRKYKHT
ncbi:gamma-glutamylcyclotransferase family protein [Variovorax sp. J2P1-59]|uniref:gamma-glutamylcyclotransferase family protein n=1 Tax=Variovorax flavidus TaxID=3053501 RepID=UPI002574EB26|nr:gamma-glutamylcyclotransferase family protein [Variovorax sp. J2P1-59]MDM0075643.1 gamma-glutamylcyclotransferase family protein [Variovorax sp. J2P1-59]